MNAKQSRLFRLGACTLSLLTLLAAGSRVSAQGVSSPLFTIHNVSPGPTVFIGSAANPVAVDLDPLGPAWNKSIGDPNQNVVGLATLNIVETLVNAGTEPWTDWHEIMLPPPVGLVPPLWTSIVSLAVNGNPIGFSVSGLGTGTIDLYNFSQPVLPGDIFGIHKTASVDGSIMLNSAFLRIQEYPTTVPEPTCLALLATGALVGVGMRRRRRS